MKWLDNYLRFIYFQICWWGKIKIYHTSRLSKHCRFEGSNKIGRNTYFHGSMGYGSYISHDCCIVANIGRFTSIAPHVRSSNGVHPYTYPYASTSPMFYSTQKQSGTTFANKMLFQETVQMAMIGSDCWIGENVFFAGGLSIGDGAVVLAGAVVTKDVPPFAIVGGVPAKVLKYRYEEEDIKFLMEHKWWDRDFMWLKQNWEVLTDINKLKTLLSE